jgi:hypothetical protein
MGGPRLDEATRQDMQLRRFRGQAKRAARETRSHQRIFSELDLDPGEDLQGADKALVVELQADARAAADSSTGWNFETLRHSPATRMPRSLVISTGPSTWSVAAP